MHLVVSMWSDKASNQQQGVYGLLGGFNWRDRTSASSRPGVWRGWRLTGDQSQDEWAQYRDLWGATDPWPIQQGLAIDHHRGPIEEGMWLKQACVEQWSIVWPTCLSSWASVPLIEGVDSLYMVHKALSVSPLGQKRWFSARGRTHYHVVAFSPQPAASISWMDFVADMVYMFVCGRRGEATNEESSPLSHIARGRTHTAYHKGASGRRNVYMMSNDSPKIGLPS